MLAIGIPFSRAQQKLRFARVDRLMNKYGFTDDPKSYNNMAMEVAQEVEANMAEYEFPILYQFAWISDFLRVSFANPSCCNILLTRVDFDRPGSISRPHSLWTYGQSRSDD